MKHSTYTTTHRSQNRKPQTSSTLVPPNTLLEAFTLVHNQLMRRHIFRLETIHPTGERFIQETEHLTPCGNRARFANRTYTAKLIKHYLITGELLERVPRIKTQPRFKAQIRLGKTVRHIGYFPTLEERDAAIRAYRSTLLPQSNP